jgi:hypothetical protein
MERVKLPHRSRLAARVEGKSSMGRLGLGVHVTAPTIHAGFGDKEGDPDYPGTALQLEIWNINRVPIILDAGLPICQLIVEEVHGTPEKGYYPAKTESHKRDEPGRDKDTSPAPLFAPGDKLAWRCHRQGHSFHSAPLGQPPGPPVRGIQLRATERPWVEDAGTRCLPVRRFIVLLTTVE